MELKIKFKSGQELVTFPTKVEFINWPVKALFVYHGTKKDQYDLITITSYIIYNNEDELSYELE